MGITWAYWILSLPMLCILSQLKLSKAALCNRLGIKWLGHEWLAEWSPNLGKGGFGTPNEALQKSKTARAAIFSWKLWEWENSQVTGHVWLGSANPSKTKYRIFPDLPSGGPNIHGCLVLVGLSHRWFLPIQTCTTRGTGKEPWQVPHSSGLELKGYLDIIVLLMIPNLKAGDDFTQWFHIVIE